MRRLAPRLQLWRETRPWVLGIQQQGVHKVRNKALIGDKERLVRIAHAQLRREDAVGAGLLFAAMANSPHYLRPAVSQQLDVLRREREV